MNRNVFEALENEEDFQPTGEPIPTNARPGSIEKLQVLCERAAAGLPLWHRDDNAHPIVCLFEMIAERREAIRQYRITMVVAGRIVTL